MIGDPLTGIDWDWERTKSGLVVPGTRRKRDRLRAASFPSYNALGINLFETNDIYPWSADPNVTWAFVADNKFTAFSGGNTFWRAQKAPAGASIHGFDTLEMQPFAGTIPTWSRDWGAQKRGSWLYDPSHNECSDAGVARTITTLPLGTNTTFTMMMAFQYVTVADSKPFFSWSNSNESSVDFIIGRCATTTHYYEMIRIPHTGGSASATSTTVADTNRNVLTYIFDGSGPTVTIRKNGTQILAPTTCSVGNINSDANSIFVIAGNRTNGITFTNMRCRAFLVSSSVLSDASIVRYENFLIAEAA
jgi:hypothetical protein